MKVIKKFEIKRIDVMNEKGIANKKLMPRLSKEYNLSIESKDLNFRTVLDCLIVDKEKNEAFPIEYKDARKPEKLYNTFKIQVFAESMLAKESFGYNVPFAFIKFEKTGDLVKIKVTEKELSQVKDTIHEINQITETEVIPEPTPFVKRCKDCCYWKICRRA